MWLDVHAHLDKLEMPVAETLDRMAAQKVEQVFTIGTEPADLPVVLEIARQHFPRVFCTLGIHPHEGGVYTPEVEDFIRKNANEAFVVAIGEIGLDYYYQHSPREAQVAAFRAQLQLAADLHLPVEIHTRDAEADTVEILKEFKGKVDGLIHCFTGTQWLAEQALNLGFDISISGVVTFKNADALREVVRFVPRDRMHIETDSPFLAPVPMRGKKNEPSFVPHTAQMVASLKSMSLDELSAQTHTNARRLFRKWRPLRETIS
jgi:TatD DNase family protein